MKKIIFDVVAFYLIVKITLAVADYTMLGVSVGNKAAQSGFIIISLLAGVTVFMALRKVCDLIDGFYSYAKKRLVATRSNSQDGKQLL